MKTNKMLGVTLLLLGLLFVLTGGTFIYAMSAVSNALSNPLLGGMMSMLFALLGGLICSGLIRLW